MLSWKKHQEQHSTEQVEKPDKPIIKNPAYSQIVQGLLVAPRPTMTQILVDHLNSAINPFFSDLERELKAFQKTNTKTEALCQIGVLLKK